MTCKETQTFMDGYLDRELDLVRSIDLERHLHDCAPCESLHQSRLKVRATLPPLRYQAPAGLKRTVQAALREQVKQETKPRFRIPWMIPVTAAVAAMLAVAFLWTSPNPLERSVVDGHVRSLMANHLMDVPSTDQHTVKPWFAGKLDFSPPVHDFSAEGFRLIGGRLDYLQHHPVAALVYQRNQHIINVFVWPSQSADRKLRPGSVEGYNTIQGIHRGFEFWLVSDLNQTELGQLAQLF